MVMAAQRLAVTAAVAVVAGLVWTAGWAAPASAGSGPPSAPEVAALAEEAIVDDAALEELRAVREVSGRPVDLVAATNGIDASPARAARLRTVADAFATSDEVGGGGVGAAEARRVAAEVLEGDDYQERSVPRPFRGPLRWLGDRLRPVTDALGDVGDAVLDAAAQVPGGVPLVVALAGVALGLVVWAVLRRRGATLVAAEQGWQLADPEADPGQLDAEADAAAAAGDHALAVRRRYEAGIVRLARADRIRLTPSTTAGQVASQVAEVEVDALTATFEAVVYGGRSASAADAAEALEGWRRVLGGVRG
jgi:hypothetical protein